VRRARKTVLWTVFSGKRLARGEAGRIGAAKKGADSPFFPEKQCLKFFCLLSLQLFKLCSNAPNFKSIQFP
jgi:hypothetical protein